ncbi:hypothetical protein [Nostoc parmelioides]|jgi:hypothetical protein|uniref:Uncharacterized protein n=1 Tax=Nostoc parmelioides FACHB-3921 TaxID=2692909 RepID=A0ABR8BP46_9NOSO|nr:hypothetical protein [Nostoc parmelioides]MBD2255545.1 hypothetical protein [Nostoc parmelioides FACHB-3921]
MNTEQDRKQPKDTKDSQGVFNKIRGIFQKIFGKKKKEQNSIYPLR